MKKWKVSVGHLLIGQFKAENAEGAVQLARLHLFRTDPGSLGCYDGLRARWFTLEYLDDPQREPGEEQGDSGRDRSWDAYRVGDEKI